MSLVRRRTTRARELLRRKRATQHLVITTPPTAAICARCGQLDEQLPPNRDRGQGKGAGSAFRSSGSADRSGQWI